MAPRKRFTTETETQQLDQEGFSHDQIAGLFILKALYTQGIYHEDDPERNRQEFIRWLYLQVACKIRRLSDVAVRGDHRYLA